MDGPNPPSISARDLYRAVGVAGSPVVLDVRPAAAFERGMIIYDALYAWCRSPQGETHNWTPPARA